MNGKPKHWPGKPLGPPDGRHLEAQFTRNGKDRRGISACKSKGMGKQAYRGPDLRISQLRNPATSVACRLNQQAGLRPATGLCPVPRGGSAPATPKNLPYEGGVMKELRPPVDRARSVYILGANRALATILILILKDRLPSRKAKLERHPAEQEERSVIHLIRVYPISGSSCIGNNS
jgi:hypothetical protein